MYYVLNYCLRYYIPNGICKFILVDVDLKVKAYTTFLLNFVDADIQLKQSGKTRKGKLTTSNDLSIPLGV